MEKNVLNNQTFSTFLLIGIGIISCWNLYTFSITQNLIALIPAVVQLIILVLVLTKNMPAKMGIKIWSILLIIGPSLSILGKTIQVLSGDDVLGKVGSLII